MGITHTLRLKIIKLENKPQLSKKQTLTKPKKGNRLKTQNIAIEESWKEALEAEFTKPYFIELVAFIKSRKKEGAVIYPPESDMFNAYNLTPFDKVRWLF